MRVQAEPTGIFCNVAGQRVRVWNGITDAGAQCFLFVSCVGVPSDEDATELERELSEFVWPEAVKELRGLQ